MSHELYQLSLLDHFYWNVFSRLFYFVLWAKWFRKLNCFCVLSLLGRVGPTFLPSMERCRLFIAEPISLQVYAMKLSSGEFGKDKSLQSEHKRILTNPARVTHKTLLLITSLSGWGRGETLVISLFTYCSPPFLGKLASHNSTGKKEDKVGHKTRYNY